MGDEDRMTEWPAGVQVAADLSCDSRWAGGDELMVSENIKESVRQEQEKYIWQSEQGYISFLLSTEVQFCHDNTKIGLSVLL